MLIQDKILAYLIFGVFIYDMSKVSGDFINSFDRRSADYVVAHADRQASRGKHPSTPYKGELNPIKALRLAMSDIAERNDKGRVHGYNEVPGRVAVLHVLDQDQGEISTAFGERMVSSHHAADFDVRFDGVDEHDYDHNRGIHPNPDGTFDITYHYI